jgi:hypothetical protein
MKMKMQITENTKSKAQPVAMAAAKTARKVVATKAAPKAAPKVASKVVAKKAAPKLSISATVKTASKTAKKPAVKVSAAAKSTENAKKVKASKPANQANNQKDMKKMDREAMMNNHRRSMESMSDASKTAVEVVKSISNMQSQYMRQMFEDFNAMMKDMSAAPLSPEVIKQQSVRMKDSFSKANEHATAVSNLMMNSNKDLYSKMQNQMHDAFEEMKYSAVSRKRPN